MGLAVIPDRHGVDAFFRVLEGHPLRPTKSAGPCIEEGRATRSRRLLRGGELGTSRVPDELEIGRARELHRRRGPATFKKARSLGELLGRVFVSPGVVAARELARGHEDGDAIEPERRQPLRDRVARGKEVKRGRVGDHLNAPAIKLVLLHRERVTELDALVAVRHEDRARRDVGKRVGRGIGASVREEPIRRIGAEEANTNHQGLICSHG